MTDIGKKRKREVKRLMGNEKEERIGRRERKMIQRIRVVLFSWGIWREGGREGWWRNEW
ncbi:MAG: hypothetical protein ACK5H4_10595 [Lacrimispora sphenoides]